MAKQHSWQQHRGKQRGSVDDETLRKNIQRKLAGDSNTGRKQRRKSSAPQNNRAAASAVPGPTRENESDFNIQVGGEGYPGEFTRTEERGRSFSRAGQGGGNRGQRRHRKKGRRGFPHRHKSSRPKIHNWIDRAVW